jgi:GT2 family glycosyltransferase
LQETKNVIPWSPEYWTVSDSEKITSLPKITIGILNYNRRNDLRRTLDCITKATEYPDFEVIVVDNASSDGSREMIADEFPGVRVIEMKENISTAARNHFYREAKGKYIFSYDDDSFPCSPATVYNVTLFLENHRNCDAISFYCYQPLTGYTETAELDEFGLSKTGSIENGYEGLHFVEGGMCLRANAWKKINGYDPDFVWGAEGLDLTLQMYQQGMKTIYHPRFATLHMKSDQNRTHSKNVYFYTRNTIWTIAKHFPLYASIPIIAIYILRRIIAIILNPRLSPAYFKGSLDAMKGFTAQRKKNVKLTLKQVLLLKRWYLPLFRW